MVRASYFGGLHTSLIVSPPCQAIHRSLPGRAPTAIAVISTLSSVRPMGRKEFAAHRAQGRGKARKDAGHLPVQAVEFAQQICAEEKIAHDWLLETGASHEERTGPRAPVRPSVEKLRRQTNRNTQRLSRLPERCIK
jgi:hypothetical protein